MNIVKDIIIIILLAFLSLVISGVFISLEKILQEQRDIKAHQETMMTRIPEIIRLEFLKQTDADRVWCTDC
jgi:ABC-type enterochelin transport system permease subunit